MEEVQKELMMGDILIQRDKTIWTKIAQFIAGQPYPHALLIGGKTRNYAICYESGPFGISEKSVNLDLINLDNYELWRPRCDYKIKFNAVQWMIENDDASYDYLNLLSLAVMIKLKIRSREKIDASKKRAYVCSEAISNAYRNSGFDLVPELQDADTKPWDLRNEQTCVRIW